MPGWDPVKGPGSSCLADDASGQCVLPWAGGTKQVSSIVLIANGLSFMVRSSRAHHPRRLRSSQFMTLIFTTVGSAADYGTFGRWLLLVVTVICWAAQFASVSLVGTISHAAPFGKLSVYRCRALARGDGSFHDWVHNL